MSAKCKGLVEKYTRGNPKKQYAARPQISRILIRASEGQESLPGVWRILQGLESFWSPWIRLLPSKAGYIQATGAVV